MVKLQSHIVCLAFKFYLQTHFCFDCPMLERLPLPVLLGSTYLSSLSELSLLLKAESRMGSWVKE